MSVWRADNRDTIVRAVSFLAKDSLAWKETRKCASCHHAPMTIWALSEAKNRGYPVDETALADLSAWVLAKDDRARVLNEPAQPAAPVTTQAPRKAPIVNEGALLATLGFVGTGTRSQGDPDALKRLLTNVLNSQGEDGSWRLPFQPRPIGSSPDIMTSLALLALNAPQVADTGDTSKAKEKGSIGSEKPNETAIRRRRHFGWFCGGGWGCHPVSGSLLPGVAAIRRMPTEDGGKLKGRQATHSRPGRLFMRLRRRVRSRAMERYGGHRLFL